MNMNYATGSLSVESTEVYIKLLNIAMLSDEYKHFRYKYWYNISTQQDPVFVTQTNVILILSKDTLCKMKVIDINNNEVTTIYANKLPEITECYNDLLESNIPSIHEGNRERDPNEMTLVKMVNSNESI